MTLINPARSRHRPGARAVLCLDDERTLALDRGRALGHARAFAAEFQASWQTYHAPDLRGYAVRRVIFVGMGGSGSASEYAAVAHSVDAGGEALVSHGAELPANTGGGDMVIVTSYSGDTAEALSVYEQAMESGAVVVAIASGGRLADLADRDQIPLLSIRYNSPPRAALPHLLAANLVTLTGAGTRAQHSLLVQDAAKAHALVTRRVGTSVPLAENPAKRLALELAGVVPILIAAGHLLPAARRMKNQLAENAKLYATLEEFPEMAHNAIEALAAQAGRGGPRLFAIFLDSRRYSPFVRDGMARVKGLLADAGLQCRTIPVEGPSALAELLAGTAWADHVSCYAALARGIDPTPIPGIARLKEGVCAEQPADAALHGVGRAIEGSGLWGVFRPSRT